MRYAYLGVVAALLIFGVSWKVFKDRDLSARDGFVMFALFAGSLGLEIATVGKFDGGLNALAMILTAGGWGIFARNLAHKFKSRTEMLRQQRR
ncbi:MAG: hypothetical protein M3N49_05235 [Candidatus Eremiobacteraeota bacterium]|nr:hypothetical protein [Candidatus Eremiobacteraeota bacterium]